MKRSYIALAGILIFISLLIGNLLLKVSPESNEILLLFIGLFAIFFFVQFRKEKKDMKTTAILINTKSWDKTLFFVLLCAVSGVMTYAAQSLLITDDLYFSFFGDQLSYDRISEIINFSRKWQWLSYAVIPFYYLMKMFMVSTCIYTGTIIAGPEISFTRIFQVALLGESIFLIPLILKLCWFLWVQPDYTLADIHSFYPLSALNLFDRESLDSWLLYPLQAMNLF